MTGWAAESTSPTTLDDNRGETTFVRVVRRDVPRETEFDRRLREVTRKLMEHPQALPRGAQLEEASRLANVGRVVRSPAERERHGWQDAPRRPCYRARRVR